LGWVLRMLLRKWLFAYGILVASLAILNQGCHKSSENPGEPVQSIALATEIKQPLAFDHEAHIKAEDMECIDCHKFVNKGPYATLPRIKDCADCHSEPQGKSPEEPKVREYTENEKEIPWVTVNRLAGHVYFSHRAHVEFGEMECMECHKDMSKETKAVVKPDIGHLTMSKCIACHKERQVETDCTSCHK
jgi:menaquinone reductase, multiheme cytochrome c subunit